MEMWPVRKRFGGEIGEGEEIDSALGRRKCLQLRDLRSGALNIRFWRDILEWQMCAKVGRGDGRGWRAWSRSAWS
jgi:hypothetical protein